MIISKKTTAEWHIHSAVLDLLLMNLA
jgi:hypothetical protein